MSKWICWILIGLIAFLLLFLAASHATSVCEGLSGIRYYYCLKYPYMADWLK